MDKNSDMTKEIENDFIVTSLSSSWKNDEENAGLPPPGLYTSSEMNCSTESTEIDSNIDGTETTTIQSTQNVQVAGAPFLNEIPSGEENSNTLGSSFITLSRLQVDSFCSESQKSNEQNYLGNISSINSDCSTSVSYGLQMTSTPMVVLLNNDKGKMETGFLLQSPSVMQTADSCYLYNRINGIYALAQANLVAQTQQDIVKQLTSITDQNESEQHTVLKSPVEMPVKENPDIKTFECEVENCNKIFLSEFQLKNHMEYHASRDKELVCSHEGCGRKFFWPAHLKYHKLTHENERNFQCNVKGCDKKFFTAQRLVVHSLTHTGERPFTCQHCNKGFTTAGNLKNHLRTHTGERPYACPEENCDKKFAEFSSLRKHQLIHTGEKPFKCEECGKSFTQSGSRQMHMKKHAVEKSGDGKKKERAKKRKTKNKSSVVVVSNKEEEMLNYQNLQVILSQGVSDQVVNVTTQTPTTCKNKLHILNEMRLSKDMHVPRILRGGGKILQGKSNSNVVVLSQPELMVPMSTAFQLGETSTGEVVYENEYQKTGLHQEEITPTVLEQQEASLEENQTLHTHSKGQTNSDISKDHNLNTDNYFTVGLHQGTKSTIAIEQRQQRMDENLSLQANDNEQSESNVLENPNLCTHVYVNRVKQEETFHVVLDHQQQNIRENLSLHVPGNGQIGSNMLTNVYINTVRQGETTHVDKDREQEQSICPSSSMYENVSLHVSEKDLIHNNISESQHLSANSKQLDINPLMELDDEQR